MASGEGGEVAGPIEDTIRSRTAEEERRRVRALTDAGVIAAMREGDTWAWGEFGVRFEPLLLAYARRIGIPADARKERVLDLLADEGMRLAEGRGVVPAQLPAYLAKAFRHRYLNAKRSSARRAAAYSAAATESDHNGARGPAQAERASPNGKTGGASVRERLIEHVCSEGALRDALGRLRFANRPRVEWSRASPPSSACISPRRSSRSSRGRNGEFRIGKSPNGLV